MKTGFRLVIGSWKITEISLPRILYISFTNTAAGGRQEKVGGLFRSTKGAGRGFGLKRVDAIVKRLGGYVSRNSEDGAFTTEILLPQ